jgi:hypothetical protein
MQLMGCIIYTRFYFVCILFSMLEKKPSPLLGRPATVEGKRVNVYLDDESLATASRLGEGNVSAGIRLALKRCERSSIDRSPTKPK